MCNIRFLLVYNLGCWAVAPTLTIVFRATNKQPLNERDHNRYLFAKTPFFQQQARRSYGADGFVAKKTTYIAREHISSSAITGKLR